MLLRIFFLLFLVFLLAPPLIFGVVLLIKKRRTAGGVTLGIYVALIGSIVIYAQLQHRSTAGHILRWFKGEYGLKQNANDLTEDAEKVVDPSELQKWAVNILQETQQTNSSFELPRDKVLDSVKNLKSCGFLFELVTCDPIESASPQNRSVWIVWGGGFGHWGMRVGPPTFKVNLASDDNYYVEWKPGIYFWCETH